MPRVGAVAGLTHVPRAAEVTCACVRSPPTSGENRVALCPKISFKIENLISKIRKKRVITCQSLKAFLLFVEDVVLVYFRGKHCIMY